MEAGFAITGALAAGFGSGALAAGFGSGVLAAGFGSGTLAAGLAFGFETALYQGGLGLTESTSTVGTVFFQVPGFIGTVGLLIGKALGLLAYAYGYTISLGGADPAIAAISAAYGWFGY